MATATVAAERRKTQRLGWQIRSRKWVGKLQLRIFVPEGKSEASDSDEGRFAEAVTVTIWSGPETRVARVGGGRAGRQASKQADRQAGKQEEADDHADSIREREGQGGVKGLMRVHNSYGNAVRCTTGSTRDPPRSYRPAICRS